MARLPVCPYCSNKVDKTEPFKKYKNKTYHMPCYKTLIKETYEENKGQDDFKQELYDYICEIFNIDEITPQIMSQIDKYYREYELTYPEMKDCLYYYLNIQKKELNMKYGVAIIPYVMNSVKELYKSVELAHELNKNVDMTKAVKKVKVKIKQPDYSYRQEIDMEEL